MRTFVALLLIHFLSLSSYAQKTFKLYSFDVKGDEGENYYEREAKRNFDSGKSAFEDADVPERFTPSLGLINAATGLKIANRKGSISDLQELLRINYEWVTNSNLLTIDELKKSSAVFVDDETVNQRAEIVNFYTVIKKYNMVLKTTNPEKFEAAKKKDSDLDLDLKDVSADLKAAEEALDEAIEAAAAMHYAKGREQSQGQDLVSNKEAAKSFRYAYEYVDNYRDAKDRYATTRKLGTTRLGLSDFENIANSGNNVAGSITYDILSYFSSRGDVYEFFEVLDRDALNRILEEQKLSISGLMAEGTTADLGELVGVNSIMIGKVTQATFEKERLDGVSRSYSKKVKVGEETYTEDGKEKTRDIKEEVTVKMSEENKIARSTVSATFKIVDVTTGRIIAVDEVSYTSKWSGTWYAYESGDKRAIPRVNQKEVEYVSEAGLTNTAASKVASIMIDRVAKYATEVSQ
ncbi:CsgG/HfaB family protein [Reichenbachiella agariperforans]|uniref:CsgG/HfaB family protein n=1 Tax=Reichenbachiella agariperforans TaxID=156994 RepID=UPI001C09D353|nr:CsgG/HfaB family protein [Reichenbachiella agariperforans]MBU2914932.1 CsgG/HfaB family protein [Reichenbachiella agariperforans]